MVSHRLFFLPNTPQWENNQLKHALNSFLRCFKETEVYLFLMNSASETNWFYIYIKKIKHHRFDKSINSFNLFL